MATVVGVVFQPGGKVYSFDPGGLELRWDERVICQTARGREYGRVVETERDLPDESLAGPLKRVVRRAGPADERADRAEPGRGQARHAALPRALAAATSLELKPISAELTFDRSRITFAFSAEERPDTRALQTELGERLKRRVELRQVGPARAGPAVRRGRACAARASCAAPATPATTSRSRCKMAKEQELPMNPGRITGSVRTATLLSRVRASALPVVPRPGAGRRTDGGDTRWEGDRAKLRGAARRVRRGMDGRTMMEIKLDRDRRGGGMSDVAFWGPGRRSGARAVPAARCARSGCGAATSSSTAPTRARPASSTSSNPDDPKPFRRRQRSTYVIAVHHLAEPARRRAAVPSTRCSSARSRTSRCSSCPATPATS